MVCSFLRGTTQEGVFFSWELRLLNPQKLFGAIGGVIITLSNSLKTRMVRCNPRSSNGTHLETLSTCNQHVKFTFLKSQEFHACISYMPAHMLGNDTHVRAMKNNFK